MDDDIPPVFSFKKAQVTELLRDLRGGLQMTTGTDPALTVKNSERPCAHTTGSHLLIDAEARTVECRLCGARLDPFDALYLFALDEQRWVREYERYKQIRAELSDSSAITKGYSAGRCTARNARRMRCKHTLAQDCKSRPGLRYCPACGQFLDSQMRSVVGTMEQPTGRGA